MLSVWSPDSNTVKLMTLIRVLYSNEVLDREWPSSDATEGAEYRLIMGDMVAKIEGAEARDFLRDHEEWSLNGWNEEPALLTLCARAGDRVAGVTQLGIEGEELTILHWASEEGSEWMLMDAAVAEASARGCTRIRAEFLATGRNVSMREFPAQFGFTMIGEEESATLWILPVSAYEPSSW